MLITALAWLKHPLADGGLKHGPQIGPMHPEIFCISVFLFPHVWALLYMLVFLFFLQFLLCKFLGDFILEIEKINRILFVILIRILT